MLGQSDPWYLDETFWTRTESFVFDQRSNETTESEVEFIASEIGPPPAQVLDLCCGIGRHSVALASSGYEVTGVDTSAHLLGRARGRMEATGVQVEWIHGDARTFKAQGKFDAVICMYSSLGQFADHANDQALLGSMNDALRDSGVAIVDILGKEVLARVFVQRDWMRDRDGRILLRERAIRDNWGRIENNWTLIEDGQQVHYKMDQRLYDAGGLVAAMGSVGFAVEKVLGGVDGRTYDQGAQRLIAVARTRVATSASQ